MGKGANTKCGSPPIMETLEVESMAAQTQLESAAEEWAEYVRYGGEALLKKQGDAKSRSRKQQLERRRLAEETLARIDSGEEDADKVLAEFLSTSNINPITSAEERRLQRIASLERPSSQARATEYRRRSMNKTEEYIARKSRSEVAPDSGISKLKFIERFTKALGFRDHLINVTAEELYRLEDDAPAGKDMENSFRSAAIRHIDAEELDISTGYIHDAESGSDYYVEVLREYNKTALFDIVLNVTDVDTGENFQSSLQLKSYKNIVDLAEGEAPTFGYIKRPADGHLSVTVANSTKAELAGRPELIAQECRVRVLATDSYLSVEPTVQCRVDEHGSRVPVTVTNNIVSTHPALHEAIAKCSTLDFKPGDKKEGRTINGRKHPDYFQLEAKVEVLMPDGSVETAIIKHKPKIQANKSGPAKNKDGSYKVLAGGDKDIEIEVSPGLIVEHYSQSFWMRTIAELMVRNEQQADLI